MNWINRSARADGDCTGPQSRILILFSACSDSRDLLQDCTIATPLIPCTATGAAEFSVWARTVLTQTKRTNSMSYAASASTHGIAIANVQWHTTPITMPIVAVCTAATMKPAQCTMLAFSSSTFESANRLRMHPRGELSIIVCIAPLLYTRMYGWTSSSSSKKVKCRDSIDFNQDTSESW
jgi:hypothetical protein